MLSAVYHQPPVHVPTVAGPGSARVPRPVSYGVGLWVALVLLLFLAPCALGAPIVLEWDPVPNATGYNVYYGEASRSYTETINVGNTTQPALSQLAPASLYYFAVTAYDDEGNESDFSKEILYQPAHPSVIWTVNAGGPKYTDGQGMVYRGHTQFSTGYSYTTTAAIAGTSDDVLYQSERHGDFSYAIPVANGDYLVTLKFAEIYWTQPGERLFNVKIEGVKVLSELDLVAEVGPKAAYDVTVPVHVADGKLNMTFQSVLVYAKVSAIVVQANRGTP